MHCRRWGCSTSGWMMHDVRTGRADLAAGRIVGWFQGRFEMGPRALGNRSILADPRRAVMKDILNARVKHREAFRPFAPAVLEEHLNDWFEMNQPDPFMTMPRRSAPRRRTDPRSRASRRHGTGADRFPRPQPWVLRRDRGLLPVDRRPDRAEYQLQPPRADRGHAGRSPVLFPAYRNGRPGPRKFLLRPKKC